SAVRHGGIVFIRWNDLDAPIVRRVCLKQRSDLFVVRRVPKVKLPPWIELIADRLDGAGEKRGHRLADVDEERDDRRIDAPGKLTQQSSFGASVAGVPAPPRVVRGYF